MSFCDEGGTLRSDPELGIRMTCSGHGGAIIVWYRDAMIFKCLESDSPRYANAYYEGLKAGLLREQPAPIDSGLALAQAINRRDEELRARQIELETTLKYHGLVLVKQYGGSVTHLIHEGLGDTQRGLCGLETRVHWRPVSGPNTSVRCQKCKNLLEKLKVLGAKEVPQPD